MFTKFNSYKGCPLILDIPGMPHLLNNLLIHFLAIFLVFSFAISNELTKNTGFRTERRQQIMIRRILLHPDFILFDTVGKIMKGLLTIRWRVANIVGITIEAEKQNKTTMENSVGKFKTAWYPPTI